MQMFRTKGDKMKTDKEIIRIMKNRISALERLCVTYRTTSRMTQTLMDFLEKTSKEYGEIRDQIEEILK